MPITMSQIAASLPLLHRRAILLLLLLSGVIMLWPGPSRTATPTSVVVLPSLVAQGWHTWQLADNNHQAESVQQQLSQWYQTVTSGLDGWALQNRIRHYDIAQGDSLSSIFARHGFSQ